MNSALKSNIFKQGQKLILGTIWLVDLGVSDSAGNIYFWHDNFVAIQCVWLHCATFQFACSGCNATRATAAEYREHWATGMGAGDGDGDGVVATTASLPLSLLAKAKMEPNAKIFYGKVEQSIKHYNNNTK